MDSEEAAIRVKPGTSKKDIELANWLPAKLYTKNKYHFIKIPSRASAKLASAASNSNLFSSKVICQASQPVILYLPCTVNKDTNKITRIHALPKTQ